jgi:hypothetical protein
MMSVQRTLLLIFMIVCKVSFAQIPSVRVLDSGRQVSIRGLSAVSDQVIWCSGSKGSVVRSTDGGKSFAWITVPGYGQRDFRDIHAFNENAALIMGIGEPAVILKTEDGGQSWQKVFEDSTKGMFLDAMDFDGKGKGTVIGDPIGGSLFQAFSTDFGASWQKAANKIKLGDGEAFFASSGTNIQGTGNKEHPYLFVSGGTFSNLYYNGKVYLLPLVKGKESTGANSIACYGRKAIIVGGDFKQSKDTNGNCILLNLRKEPVFTHALQPPSGYRSCVIYVSKKILLSCGTSGVDISYDEGLHWKHFSDQGFHVVQKARKGKTIFLAGSDGKIACLQFP